VYREKSVWEKLIASSAVTFTKRDYLDEFIIGVFTAPDIFIKTAKIIFRVERHEEHIVPSSLNLRSYRPHGKVAKGT